MTSHCAIKTNHGVSLGSFEYAAKSEADILFHFVCIQELQLLQRLSYLIAFMWQTLQDYAWILTS